MKLSDIIQELCKQKNITISELAKRINQTPQSLTNKLIQDTITPDELTKIVNALGIIFIDSEKQIVKPKSKTNKICYIIGSVVLTVSSFMVIPSLIDKIGRKKYKLSSKNEKIDFDDLGPKIVKKNESKEN